MFTLATTRFNYKTWMENQQWRNENDFRGCIYGTPRRVSERFPIDTHFFVLEMNNDENKIKGIGMIKNLVITNYCKIYSDGNYNRYAYKGKYRIDRNSITEEENIIMNVLDQLLFKGERHMKRGQGIIAVPDWITKNTHFDFVGFIRNIFRKRISVLKKKYNKTYETTIHE